jgi:acetyl-CoA acetyltransferase
MQNQMTMTECLGVRGLSAAKEFMANDDEASPMRRDGLRRDLVTLCIGGGEGIALVIETLH